MLFIPLLNFSPLKRNNHDWHQAAVEAAGSFLFSTSAAVFLLIQVSELTLSTCVLQLLRPHSDWIQKPSLGHRWLSRITTAAAHPVSSAATWDVTFFPSSLQMHPVIDLFLFVCFYWCLSCVTVWFKKMERLTKAQNMLSSTVLCKVILFFCHDKSLDSLSHGWTILPSQKYIFTACNRMDNRIG